MCNFILWRIIVTYSVNHLGGNLSFLLWQAFDQQQQDLVDAASKALSYRQEIIEENIRLTYALQVYHLYLCDYNFLSFGMCILNLRFYFIL